MTTSLVTTAIPYVNARPHLGFAYEFVLADVLARHRRRRGRDVRFVTGSDDNSLKNVAAAAREGLSPRALVDRNAGAFRALGPLLDVAPDDFVATSSDPRHRAAVDWLWRACAASGDLYRRSWTGRYCAGCEAFVDDDVAICAEHGVAPEPVAEDNWFFRLSRWRAPVRDAIASGRLAIVPDAARAETLAFLDGEVRDLSVSRVATRSGGWGLPVPGDPGQVVYVWFDALTNYLASLGLGGGAPGKRSELLDRYWHAGERTHVLGKGITRFHAVYWPAFLLSAGLPLPDRIFVHGYLTVDGHKISKSGRNVEVAPLVEATGADALRWFFVRRCRTHGDADVSTGAITGAYNHDLADGLGNLVQRTTALAARLSQSRVPAPGAETLESSRLRALAGALPCRIDAALDGFLLDDAAAAVIELIDAANRCLEAAAPWRIARTDPAAAAAALYAPLEAARIAAGELSPFVPGIARTIAERLGDADVGPGWGRLSPGAALRGGPPPVPRKHLVSG
ncbi:MAG TPA: methionine--tRNA ligase [Kofleriaceae bacterium]|nr:methionine--tRNA ligase [Kofleriaceae bacterium]